MMKGKSVDNGILGILTQAGKCMLNANIALTYFNADMEYPVHERIKSNANKILHRLEMNSP